MTISVPRREKKFHSNAETKKNCKYETHVSRSTFQAFVQIVSRIAGSGSAKKPRFVYSSLCL